MTYDEYPLCCGGAIINDFGNTQTTGGYRDELSPEVVEAYVSRVLFEEPDYDDVYDDSVFDTPQLHENLAFVQVALNETQRTALHATFVKLGFEPSRRMFHPGHGSWITLYTRINHPERKHPDET